MLATGSAIRKRSPSGDTPTELGERSRHDRRPGLAQDVEGEVQIVDGEEPVGGEFTRDHQVPQIGA